MAEKITAGQIRALLDEKYNDSRQYVIAHEVGLTTGGGCRRLDFVVMNCYQSKRFSIEGIEIKVSKADLRRELEHAEKHADFYGNLDYYSLAAPSGIVDIDTIPKHWGIYAVVGEPAVLVTQRKPLMLNDPPIDSVDKGFMASFARSAARLTYADDEKEIAIGKAIADYKKRYTEEHLDFLTRSRLEHAEQLEELFGNLAHYSDGRRMQIIGLAQRLASCGAERFIDEGESFALRLTRFFRNLETLKETEVGDDKN